MKPSQVLKRLHTMITPAYGYSLPIEPPWVALETYQ